jgi:hypothetical protein
VSAIAAAAPIVAAAGVRVENPTRPYSDMGDVGREAGA